jgi:hypothetical protein
MAFFFPVGGLLVATQYEIPFKVSISTFHVSVMAITPAIASHKVRHPSPSNFSVLMAPRQKVSWRDPEWGCGDGGGATQPKNQTQTAEYGSEVAQRILLLCTSLRIRNLAMCFGQIDCDHV